MERVTGRLIGYGLNVWKGGREWQGKRSEHNNQQKEERSRRWGGPGEVGGGESVAVVCGKQRPERCGAYVVRLVAGGDR